VEKTYALKCWFCLNASFHRVGPVPGRPVCYSRKPAAEHVDQRACVFCVIVEQSREPATHHLIRSIPRKAARDFSQQGSSVATIQTFYDTFFTNGFDDAIKRAFVGPQLMWQSLLNLQSTLDQLNWGQDTGDYHPTSCACERA
jgi:hypothetical protein